MFQTFSNTAKRLEAAVKHLTSFVLKISSLYHNRIFLCGNLREKNVVMNTLFLILIQLCFYNNFCFLGDFMVFQEGINKKDTKCECRA